MTDRSRTRVLEKAPRGETGRVPARCGVVGQGPVSARIAHALLVAGADVVLVAPDDLAVVTARRLVEDAVQASVRQGEVEYLRKGMSRLHPTTEPADLAGVEVTVRVPEHEDGTVQVVVVSGTDAPVRACCVDAVRSAVTTPTTVLHEGIGS